MADIYPVGAVEFFVAPRSAGSAVSSGAIGGAVPYYYLGSSVAHPIIENRILHKDLTCDRSGDGAWQKVGMSEQHIVTTTINRINMATLLRLRTGSANPVTYSTSPGKLILNVKDCRLFVRYQFANVQTSLPLPTLTPKGRLYYSATLEACREAQPKRVQEVGLIFECNQLWDNKNRKWKFYTDDDTSADWPQNLVLE